jgi:aldehyde dehydrogenase (NAD+)
MWEYLVRGSRVAQRGARGAGRALPAAPKPVLEPLGDGVDRTAKLYIGGKQVRPDGGYSRVITSPKGKASGEVGEGNRKDIRNAVEAAHKAAGGWSRATAHLRAQVLYYVAENLDARGEEFAKRIASMTGDTARAARREVGASVQRLFTWAAWADKYDGAVHSVPIRGVALAMHEPIGVVGVACPDESPLLGIISLVAPLVATGNTVIAIPSEPHPLAATDLYQVLDTSDMPGGVINIVTGDRDALSRVLAEHDDVEAMWYVGSAAGVKAVEHASASNMKRTWCSSGAIDWYDDEDGAGAHYLRHAVQVKNVWIPYGE